MFTLYRGAYHFQKLVKISRSRKDSAQKINGIEKNTWSRRESQIFNEVGMESGSEKPLECVHQFALVSMRDLFAFVSRHDYRLCHHKD